MMLPWNILDPSLLWCDGTLLLGLQRIYFFQIMLSWLLLLSFVQVNEYVADEFIPILDTFDNEYFEKLILCIAVSCQ